MGWVVIFAWISLALNAITLCVLVYILRQMRQTDRILDDIEASLDNAEDALDKINRDRAAKAASS
jgi:uncharacterized protein YoxC